LILLLGHGIRHQSGRVIRLGLATDAMAFRAHLDTVNIRRAGPSGMARAMASVTCLAGTACRLRSGSTRLAIEPFRGECVSRGVSPSEMQQRTCTAREPQEWLERWLWLLELQEWAYERELELRVLILVKQVNCIAVHFAVGKTVWATISGRCLKYYTKGNRSCEAEGRESVGASNGNAETLFTSIE